MRVLLTGGTGFIGSYVLMELLGAGHEVTVMARNPDKVPALRELSGVAFLHASLADHDQLRAAVAGHNAVVHVALGWGDEAETMLLNDTLPSVILMEAAAAAGVERFIYTSSTAAVGEMDRLTTPERRPRPMDFYGATKASTESFLFAMSHRTSMRGNVIRPGYTFGNPVVAGASVESDRRFRIIVENALAGRPVEVTRYDGTQFISAGDLARLFRAVIESDDNRETYHGLAEDFVTWETIAERAIELCGSSSELQVIDRGWEPLPRRFDVSKNRSRFDLRFTGRDKLDDHLRYFLRSTVEATANVE